MTALKLMLAVGSVLGAGLLAWTAESAAKDKGVAIVKRAAASFKRECAAFVKFIGEDASERNRTKDRETGTAATSSEPWRNAKLTESAGSSV